MDITSIQKQLKHAAKKVGEWFVKLVSPVREFVQEYIIGRWKYFHRIRRFALAWIGFVGLLFVGGLVQTLSLVNSQQETYPVPGGRLREGVVGEFTNFNPLFAETNADRSASKLMFSSLLEYDDAGRLQPELAESWTSNEDADVYTVTLKDNLRWHDGETLNAEDVVFTVELMKDPRLGVQRLLDTWADVEVESKGERKVIFRLPNSLAPFPPLLRLMVVPEHVLGAQPVEALRSYSFNQNPVGSGPFEFSMFNSDENQLTLEANKSFFNGSPLLDRYQLQAYEDESARVAAMDAGQIDFYASDQPTASSTYTQHTARLSRTRYLFFNTRKDAVTDSAELRRALTQAINPAKFGDSNRETIQGIVLEDQLDLDEKYHQLPYSLDSARDGLDELGWTNSESATMIRTNSKGKQLRLRLIYPDREQEQQQARRVRDQLRKAGVGVDLVGLDQSDFNETVFVKRNFDMVLAGVDSGIDPDVFVYWHTSQTDEGGLNISGIRNDELDRALAAGRTRSATELRKAKYQTAARVWRNEAPAVSLTQDSYYIVSRSRVRVYDGELMSNIRDRYYDVERWTSQVTEQLPANYDGELDYAETE